MRGPTLPIALVLGASMAVTAASCFVAGYEVAEVSTTTDAGAAGTGGQAGCGHASPPAAPDASGGGSDVDIVLAVRSIAFGEESVTDGTGPTVGYDLDHFCTCQGEEAECPAPSWPTEEHCDGPAGRDNAFAYIFEASGAIVDTITSGHISGQIDAGTFGLLLHVSGYNGQPNDDVVAVALYATQGLDDEPCAPSPTPAWDGTDRWPVVHTAIAGQGGADAGIPAGGAGGCSSTGLPGLAPTDPKYVDAAAYVTGGVLTASFAEVAILMSSQPNLGTLTLGSAFVTGRLQQLELGGPWSLTGGLLVGRASIRDVLAAVGGIVAADDPFCTDHDYYDYVESVVCRFPDVRTAVAGPTSPCDGISFGMGFEASPAELGRVLLAPGTLATPCAAEVDPRADTCEDQ